MRNKLGWKVVSYVAANGIQCSRLVREREPRTRKPKVKDVLDEKTRRILGYGADPLSRAKGTLHVGKTMGGMVRSADKSMFVRTMGRLKLKTNRRV
jgi:hypothetical protein